MWPVLDLKEYLSGQWRLNRVLLDRRNSIRGKLTGEASFCPEGSSLSYTERGTLVFGSHEGPAEQSYSYLFPAGHANALVAFRDGRTFHDLDLSNGRAVVRHSCTPDLYEGLIVAIDRRRWRSTWAVTGPRKDLEIRTLFTRCCNPAAASRDYP